MKWTEIEIGRRPYCGQAMKIDDDVLRVESSLEKMRVRMVTLRSMAFSPTVSTVLAELENDELFLLHLSRIQHGAVPSGWR